MILIDKSDVSPDTRRLLFALESPNQPLGLPVGQHLMVFAPNKPGVVPGMWYAPFNPFASLSSFLRDLFIPTSPPLSVCFVPSFSVICGFECWWFLLRNGQPDPDSTAKEIYRKYTPISSSSARGKVELVIKVYSKMNVPPMLDGGKMSQYMEALQIGDKIDVEGPYG